MNEKTLDDIINELFDLASTNPLELIQLLNNESNPLLSNNNPMSFECPKEISSRFPINYNNQSLYMFRKKLNNSFIFYQHLRKAGGTAFCDLANKNLKRSEVPSYYCMPDNKGALASPPWNDSSFLLNNIYTNGYRIVANEWDVYLSQFMSLPNVVVATTFRHPIDRWYSQYRFEHLEHRDGSSDKKKPIPFIRWYDQTKTFTMNTNYYVKTFIGNKVDTSKYNKNDFYWTYHQYNKIIITKDIFKQSLNNLLQFHIILILEYLSYPIVQQYLMYQLDFHQPIKQILPHEIQAIRLNHTNIAIKNILNNNDYNYICKDNIYDILLFEIIKRILLERLYCDNNFLYYLSTIK